MPRKRNIRYTLQRELDVQVHFGRKKHLDKQQTYKERKKAKSKGLQKITLEECTQYIQPYTDYLVDKGLSSTSIHTALAGICKSTHTCICVLLIFLCRCKNIERLIHRGKPIEYDKIASMYVSLTVLNHYRVDTTTQNYISK